MKKWLLLTLLGLIVIFLFLPFDLNIAPKRELQILDETGVPLVDGVVKQIWRHHALGVRGDWQTRSNEKGLAFLPKRNVGTNVFCILVGSAREIGNQGINASLSSIEIISIVADGYSAQSFLNGSGLEGQRRVIKMVRPGDRR